jgi:hypothetical protein
LLLGLAVGALAVAFNFARRPRTGRSTVDDLRDKGAQGVRDAMAGLATGFAEQRRQEKERAEAARERRESAGPVSYSGPKYTCELPPDADYPTVTARYAVGEGGWGPAPHMTLQCKSCGHEYSIQQTSYGSPPPPDVRETMKWMRKQCPKGEGNCRV